MGNKYCCAEKYTTDNSHENLIMEIIMKLKIRNLKILEIKNLFEKKDGSLKYPRVFMLIFKKLLRNLYA